MLFLRHGHAAPSQFGVDLVRSLSEKGIGQAEAVRLPVNISDLGRIFVSPAARALETAQVVVPNKSIIVLPYLYGAILLPEMNEMYAEHGDNISPYIADPRCERTKEMTKVVADQILAMGGSKTSLVVAHSLIINLIAHHIYGVQAILDINFEPATGFWLKDGSEIITF